MFKNILVPVDGSATSLHGLAQAIRLAADQKATLTILHVVDEEWLYRTTGIDGSAYYLAETIRDMTREGKSILAKALATAKKKGVKTVTVMVEDQLSPVADVIIQQARKQHADLIVLGTHGRRGLSRLVMGSDAEGVVRQSDVPVVLVRGPKPAAKRRPAKSPAKASRSSRATAIA